LLILREKYVIFFDRGEYVSQEYKHVRTKKLPKERKWTVSTIF
jgi:hypothetical protein